jgi:hypothetical protein
MVPLAQRAQVARLGAPAVLPKHDVDVQPALLVAAFDPAPSIAVLDDGTQTVVDGPHGDEPPPPGHAPGAVTAPLPRHPVLDRTDPAHRPGTGFEHLDDEHDQRGRRRVDDGRVQLADPTLRPFVPRIRRIRPTHAAILLRGV